MHEDGDRGLFGSQALSLQPRRVQPSASNSYVNPSTRKMETGSLRQARLTK